MSYYTYIESWTLTYTLKSLKGDFLGMNIETVGDTFNKYVDLGSGINLPGWAFLAFVITLVLNIYIVSRGLTDGIEKVAKKGLQLVHYGSIVINANTKIGENCRIHTCTNIGTANKSSKAPVIGDNVYIGPGAKIYGEITIASNIKIAPNAAVSKDFLMENVIIGGVPAKQISKSK